MTYIPLREVKTSWFRLWKNGKRPKQSQLKSYRKPSMRAICGLWFDLRAIDSSVEIKVKFWVSKVHSMGPNYGPLMDLRLIIRSMKIRLKNESLKLILGVQTAGCTSIMTHKWGSWLTDSENSAGVFSGKTTITFYSKLRLMQTWWCWKEDSYTFNLIGHGPLILYMLKVVVVWKWPLHELMRKT